MTLLNTVTALTQEIHYLDEMIASLQKKSHERQAILAIQCEAAQLEDRQTTTAVISELSELKRKLSLLIDAPAAGQNVDVPPLGRPTPDNDRSKPHD